MESVAYLQQKYRFFIAKLVEKALQLFMIGGVDFGISGSTELLAQAKNDG
jgi:hypothetical protein